MKRGRRYVYCAFLLALAGLSLGAVLHGLWPGRATLTCRSPAVTALRNAVRHANLVIVVMDAARADHLGCYGYARDTTPHIDALAEDAIVFHNHFCEMPLTTASTISLFRSQYPDTHCAYYEVGEHDRASFTLASALACGGFRTALFSSNPSASPAVGVGTDFHEAAHRIYPVTRGRQFSPEALLLRFRAWVEANRRSRFFVYIHFLPPHTPYHQPTRFTERFVGRIPPGFRSATYTPCEFELPIEDRPPEPDHPPLPRWIDLYDANLCYADWAVGQVVECLTGAGVFETTLLIVTSDHGEAFGEHGFIWHAHAIHDEATHVPLVLRFPGSTVPPGHVKCLTRTIDLAPTLCDLFEIPYRADQVQGRSLLPVLAGETDTAAQYSIAKSYGPRKYMIRDGRHALLLYRNPEWRALYDTKADPGETNDILHERPEVAERLHRSFRAFAEAQRRPPRCFLDPEAEPLPEPRPPETALPPEVRRNLEGLGYLR